MFLLATFLLGGCQIGKDKLPSEMEPKDLPEGRAFEDEFTRSLLQSTEEVLPGYYPFLAKNGRWEMAFPENGLTGERMYISKQNTESILFTDWEEGKDTSATIDVKYYSYYNPGDVETKQKSIEAEIGFSLEFEEVAGNGQTYYIARLNGENEKIDAPIYGLAAYIQNENDAGGFFVFYTIHCEEDCEEVKETELEKALDWLMTIQFI